MRFVKNSELYSLNRSTYVFIGQIISIFIVEFILNFKFNYLPCLGIIFFGVLTNIYLQFKTKENQINNSSSLFYLVYDIIQLGILFFFTGGITNPFIFLLIIPAVFSSQYLSIQSSVILVFFTVSMLVTLTFFIMNSPTQKSYIFMFQTIIYLPFHYQF